MEIKNLNLIPEGDKPVIHASQFDENRSVRFDLKDGTEDYTLLSGLVVTCNIKKVDGNIVTFAVENTESTYVVITLPLQATSCAGPNIGEIVISDESNEDSIIIGTINFILEVERSPMIGGIESKSDIHDLEEQIETIVTQVIATDYYTKTQIDNMLLDIMPVNSVSGAVANFDTLIVAPLVSLKTYIVAQGGGGTPTIPIPITGFSSITLTCADEDMQIVDTFTLSLGQNVYGGYVDWKNGKLILTWSELIDLGDLTWVTWGGITNGYRADLPNMKKPTTNPERQTGFLCSNYPASTNISINDNMDDKSLLRYNGQLILKDSSISSVSDVASAVEGFKLIYELATPIEIDLTAPTMPSTIQGVQNWFADSGDIDISFKQDIQNYVDSKISSVNANRTLSMIRPVNTEESKGDEDER